MKNKNTFRYLFVGIVIVFGLTFFGCSSKEKDTPPTPVTKVSPESRRLYQLEMTFIKDAATFLQYKQKLRGLAVVHNGYLERTLVVDGMLSKDGVKPDLVNIIYYDSAEAKAIVENDPEYLALSSLRDSALMSVSVSGESIGGELGHGKTAQRVYLIEFVQYRDGDSSAYTDYSETASTVMERYGYHLERIIRPTSSEGIAQPDLIRIMYFDSADKLVGMQKDPDFSEMMKQYEISLERSLWIVGKTPPAVGQIDQLLGNG